ncbi:MAG: response regulator transcription factor [Candidatus Bipolaricaulota bacterium]|nr:response regulator transcription factor [Candidatus Bipolaricaulota bacterium]
MVRILIVDDHPVVREGLARLLAERGAAVVGLAATGEEGIRLAQETGPDLIVWDLAMPGGGVEGLRRLREAVPGARILVLTALEGPGLGQEVRAAGADGLLFKASSAEEVWRGICACLRGEGPFPPVPSLSPREEEVLRLLGAGRSNRELAQELGISVKTVESHVESLKAKLGCRSAAELRALALRRAR